MQAIRPRVLTLVATLLAVVLLPVPAVARVGTAATDDDIPGVVLPAPPATSVTGTLDYTVDEDDVYSVQLTAGEWLFASMTGAPGTDFDLYLFGPSATTVRGATAAVAFSENHGSSAERILYQAKVTGTYYLDAWAFDGSGAYKITYGFPVEQPVLSALGPETVKWGASAVIGGTLTAPGGAPASGEKLYLYARPYGASTYTPVTTVRTDAAGVYSFTVTPSRQTRYSVKHLGSPHFLPVTAATLQITPKAYLTIPSAPTEPQRNVPFTSVGYLKPRHPAGANSVTLDCYRLQEGAWVLRKTVLATNENYSSYTRYRARFSLPYAGKWKIVASVAGDGLHAATTSNARYRTVR